MTVVRHDPRSAATTPTASYRVFLRHLRGHLDEALGTATPSFDALAAYVCGYDAGTGGIALAGFVEWLALQTGRYAARWPELIVELAFAGIAPPMPLSADEDAIAIAATFDWVDRFLAETGEGGQRDVFRRFESWNGERRARRITNE